MLVFMCLYIYLYTLVYIYIYTYIYIYIYIYTYGRAQNNAFRDLLIARRRATNRYAYPYAYPCFIPLYSYPVFIPLFHTLVVLLPYPLVPYQFVSYPFHTRCIPVSYPPAPPRAVAPSARSFHTLFSYSVSICFQTLCFHTLFSYPVGGYANLWRQGSAP